MFFPKPKIEEQGKVDYADEAFRSMKRGHIAKIVVFSLFVLYFLFHYFIYWDPREGCFIQIKPAFLEFTNLDMKRALKALKYGSPEDYRTVCRNVETINPVIGCGGFGGGCYYQGRSKTSASREIHVSTAKDDLVTAMAVMVHETCHAIQAKEGRSLDEQECYLADDKTLRQVVTIPE